MALAHHRATRQRGQASQNRQSQAQQLREMGDLYANSAMHPLLLAHALTRHHAPRPLEQHSMNQQTMFLETISQLQARNKTFVEGL